MNASRSAIPQGRTAGHAAAPGRSSGQAMGSAAMDVGGWLRGLGLGQYEDKFRDNKVDTDLLPRLTADDLRDIGVSAVGDRRRLLDAIAALAAALPGGSAVDRTPEDGRPSGRPMERAGRVKGATPQAERRPVTVMFCDLVGSTSLAASLDAEDWRNLVSAYLDAASAAVTELGGHVLKKLGDGLMALFGYPRAQENDAERAVRAALAIQRALAELNARNAAKGAPELVARIGLDSGPVVVDATGEVFGDAPNIAARVQALADPASVLVTANVQRQTAGLFVAEDKGAPELKGVAPPVNLYRIVRASGGRRFGTRALTPLVGREEELGHLCRRWEKAAAGEGQLALVVGEPGIGNSRLVEEVRATLGETPHTWAEFPSSQLLQNTPLHPVAEWGRQRFGGADTPASQRLADLENTHLGWARGRINDPVAGSVQLRRVLSAFVDQGVRVNLGFCSGLLAGLEAKTLGSERALARIDEAFRLSNEVEHRCSLPFLHRLRGEILQKGDPADPVPVEEAFRTSIGIAKEQGARSPVLLA